jgi:predicted secreted protein
MTHTTCPRLLHRIPLLLVAALATPAFAQMQSTPTGAMLPAVTVAATATATVPNDRMHAWLRAESENADPAKAASEVNAKTARALARAKAMSGVEAATTGYSSYQVTEKNVPARWRVSQTITLQGADFAQLATLVTRLQADDALILTGMNFSVSDATRRAAEDALTQQAIRSWQARAQSAAQGLGFTGWHVGRVTVQTNDYGRPQPMMRVAAAPSQSAGAPVAIEAGNTDVSVTVSGDAVLDAASARPR